MRASPSTAFRIALAAAAVTAVVGSGVQAAHARDFFSSFVDVLSGRPPPPPQPQRALGYNDPADPQSLPRQPSAPAVSAGRSTAYCVRTCDGRYFPIAANNEQSRAATCSSLCPASDTKVYYGSSIDHATSDSGKPYSSLPNAFKYREQLVGGCTCNGKDSVGLASISIEDDKTLRKGDIVAGASGLIVATRTADRKRSAVANFSPAPQSIRAKFERAHALALQ
jgi:hypothetical protein